MGGEGVGIEEIKEGGSVVYQPGVEETVEGGEESEDWRGTCVILVLLGGRLVRRSGLMVMIARYRKNRRIYPPSLLLTSPLPQKYSSFPAWQQVSRVASASATSIPTAQYSSTVPCSASPNVSRSPRPLPPHSLSPPAPCSRPLQRGHPCRCWRWDYPY